MPPLATHDRSNHPHCCSGVIEDLLAAVRDEELTDLSLITNDGTSVPANRFVLAARSKVMKRMLYGNFRESKSSEIYLTNYTTSIVKAVVEYCCHDTIDESLPSLIAQQGGGTASQKTTVTTTTTATVATTTTTTSIEATEKQGRRRNKVIVVRADEYAVRQLIALQKAADFLDLPGLQDHTSLLVRDIIVKNPWLACVVFDEADPGSDLECRALNIIKCRPYVALLPPDDNVSGGGIECLRAERLVAIMRDHDIEAGELFMFDMLKRWVEHSSVEHSDETVTASRNYYEQQQELVQLKQQHQEAAAFRRDVALYCSLHHIRLHYIEPQDLLSKVKKSNLVPKERIIDTIKRQAITALQDRVWHLTCRGQVGVDRVLVEGAGMRDVNGIYHRIDGLTNGDIYSKHEVSCGQQHAYTISCSHNVKDGMVECRIFCSKVLTHDAVKILHKMRILNPLFQPLLQVIKIELPRAETKRNVSSLNRYRHLYLSDGEHYIPATLGAEVIALVENKDIVENTLIKVLEYDIYELDRCKAIHVTRVNLVRADPGHLLGSPTSISGVEIDRYITLSDEENEGDNSSTSSSHASTPFADTAAAAQREGLRQLYCCQYPIVFQVKDSKVPRIGWEADIHGKGPNPKCTWIPASEKLLDERRINNVEEDISSSLSTPPQQSPIQTIL